MNVLNGLDKTMSNININILQLFFFFLFTNEIFISSVLFVA